MGFFSGIQASAYAIQPDHLKLYTTQGEFDTVKQDVVNAITGAGLVIDHTSHIGAMLERTGKDLGTTQQVYG